MINLKQADRRERAHGSLCTAEDKYSVDIHHYCVAV